MPNLDDARQQLDLAEQAALSGDLTSAHNFLISALRIQEVELGPQHPDLISTLSNLAIIAERTGRNDEAEAGYRRAATLASAVLPRDHEMAVESRRNLEAFCREHGVEAFPAAIPPVPAAPPVAKPAPVENPIAHEPSRPVQQRSLSPMLWLGIGATIVAVVVLVQISNSRPTNEAGSPEATGQPTSLEPVTSPSPAIDIPTQAPAPQGNEPAPAAATTPANAETSFATTPPAAAAGPSGAEASIVIAQLCRQFSAGANWQCDPPSDPAIPGSMVLYTRIRSAGDTAVAHRWYRGDVLRQSVRLTVRANPAEGFRTYSRHTVDTGGWRVEVRSADGDLLHEQRFSVR